MVAEFNLSLNELRALLARTFEALYGHDRDFSAMADLTLWLEYCGHGGIEILIQALPGLEKEDLDSPGIIKKSEKHLLIDCGGKNLISSVHSIGDLAMALAADHGDARLDIENVENGQFLLGVLKYASSQGFWALANYHKKIAVIETYADYPMIYSSRSEHGLSLICAKSKQGFDQYSDPEEGEVFIDVAAQKKAYANNLNLGLAIKNSHYHALSLIADRVLVEASDMSRKGAGE